MLASLAVSAGIGTTFYWDRPEMGRWCLYALNVPCDDPVASAALPPLPPRLAASATRRRRSTAPPQYNVAWSFGRAGFYTKLEKSYAKDADYFLTVEMGGNLTHPLARGGGLTCRPAGPLAAGSRPGPPHATRSACSTLRAADARRCGWGARRGCCSNRPTSPTS